ncbi:hypothetical protein [Aliiglaciecola lipolytica]|uniref:Uncharacterized protein n=1 Tax=Aliiglaciecola lipolytica E3 TaxID=1127673 RepID=K6WZL7_9ALTE|nr:hypothetical protein [Aliiglaciecola lipolytica]GAC13849.1 hypothetical protein GLIP_1208 [Aliiglaciecola lipolytica E3]
MFIQFRKIKLFIILAILTTQHVDGQEVTSSDKPDNKLNSCVVPDDRCMLIKLQQPVGEIMRRGEIAKQPFIFSYQNGKSELPQYFLVAHGENYLRIGFPYGRDSRLKVTTFDGAVSTMGGYCYLTIHHPKNNSWIVSSRFQYDGSDDFVVEGVVPSEDIVDFSHISSQALLNDALHSISFTANTNLKMQIKHKSQGKYAKGIVPLINFFNKCRVML